MDQKGHSLRIEVGPRDVAAQAVFVGRRDKPAREKESIPRAAFVETCGGILTDMQNNLYNKAAKHLKENTVHLDNIKDFTDYFTPQNADKPEIHGGFALAHFSPSSEVLDALKELKVTARCVPLDSPEEPGTCIFSGRPSQKRMIFAKAY